MPASMTAEAGANIAFIKYWGNRPEGGNLPLNPSISMTLASCVSRTTVEFLPGAPFDDIYLGHRRADEATRRRIGAFLDLLRSAAGSAEHLTVRSLNSFPTGCGIASSASGFAALALAAATLYGLRPSPAELSRMARLGSGSAARSVPGGFVELYPGAAHEDCYAEQIAPETAWPELRDLVLIFSGDAKKVSSADGHRIAHTSGMLPCRLAAVTARADRVRNAILRRDLQLLGESAEEDAISMHAVMMTSKPPLFYWIARTLDAIRLTLELRRQGTGVWFTIDAGPNVHVLVLDKDLASARAAYERELGCQVIVDRPGPGARLVETPVR